MLTSIKFLLITTNYSRLHRVAACARWISLQPVVALTGERVARSSRFGGYEHYYYRLSFTGKPLEIRQEHTTADTINVEILRYTYDNMERQLTTSVERDGAEPVLLCSNTYDNLGRLATHGLGGTAGGNHAIIRTFDGSIYNPKNKRRK